MPQIPLLEFHKKIKAQTTLFANYEMPIGYDAIKNEYLAVRENVGIFDISHMLPILVCDKNKNNNSNFAQNFLDYITPRKIPSQPNTAQYNVIINKNFHILDDVIIYCIDTNEYVLIANANNREKILSYLNKMQAEGSFSVSITPYKKYVFLAIQGPHSEQLVQKIFPQYTKQIQSLYFYQFLSFFCTYPFSKFYQNRSSRKDFHCIISRTGYTGEDGFEILVPEEMGHNIAKFLYGHDVQFCGLAVRDILRIEMSYLLYGSDIMPEDTPYDVSLDWIVNTEKDFIASHLIKKFQSNKQHTVQKFILCDKGVARESNLIYDKPISASPTNKYPIGKVTSGSFSFLHNKGIGLAKISKETELNKNLYIDIRGRNIPIQILQKNFYKGSIRYKKNSRPNSF